MILRDFTFPIDMIELTIEKKMRGITIIFNKLMNNPSTQWSNCMCSGKKGPQTAPKIVHNNINVSVLLFIVCILKAGAAA